MVRKILNYLPRNWGPKVTVVEEAKDLTKMGLNELLGSLMTHEITLKSNEKIDERKKKREIAFKTSLSQTNEARNDDEERPCLQDDSTKCSRRVNFHKDKVKKILAEKKNQTRCLLFAMNARSRDT